MHTLAMPAKDNHNLGGADVVLPVVPYFHANGWGLPHLCLAMGMRVLHNGRFTDPETTLQIAVDHSATYTAAVPAIWQMARTQLQAEPERYAAKFLIKTIACGGTAPAPEMMKWYKDTYNIEFVQGWGMTELGPMGTLARGVQTMAHASLSREEQFLNITNAGIPVLGVRAFLPPFLPLFLPSSSFLPSCVPFFLLLPLLLS
jgi:fatty-acyl-CoA synthase